MAHIDVAEYSATETSPLPHMPKGTGEMYLIVGIFAVWLSSTFLALI